MHKIRNHVAEALGAQICHLQHHNSGPALFSNKISVTLVALPHPISPFILAIPVED